jgi:hypothetical protein
MEIVQIPLPKKQGRTICLLAAVVTTLGALHFAVAQGGEEEADLKTEERFHKIYKTYNEQPTSNEAWEKALSNRKANTYPIQNKDTLWDISNTFFGDSNYWPKIWSYNTDNILNPHEISPKNVIKFYPGTMSEAPTIGLADAKAPPEAMPSKIIEKTPSGSIEGIVIPPPKRTSRPLVKNLPKSLPLYRLGRVNTPPLQFESESLVKKIPVPIKDLVRYVTDQELKSVGEVVESELISGETAANFQYIVVRLEDSSQKSLVAYKDDTKVSDPFGSNSKGTVVQVLGEIEVMERVSDSDKLYRAMVRRIVDPVEVGAKLMVGKMQTFNADKTAVTSSVQARIVGGENHRYIQDLFGDDNVVFLNAGSRQGLQVNSSLPIFKNEKIRNSNTGAVINDRVVGTLKVIKVAENYATGYVVTAATELMIGDYVGGRAPSGNGGMSTDPSSSSASAKASADEGLTTEETPATDGLTPEETPANGNSSSSDEELKL